MRSNGPGQRIVDVAHTPRITFVASTLIPASADAVLDWHEAPGAFQRLTPPREPVRVLRHYGGIKDGARVSLVVGPWPFALGWELEHRDYRHGRSFTDVQVTGPFRSGGTSTGWFRRGPMPACWKIRSSTNCRSASSAGCWDNRSPRRSALIGVSPTE